MKYLQAVLRILLIVALSAFILYADSTLNSNFSLLSTHAGTNPSLVCNTTEGGGPCPVPQLQPYVTEVVIAAALLGLVVGWWSRAYISRRKVGKR